MFISKKHLILLVFGVICSLITSCTPVPAQSPGDAKFPTPTSGVNLGEIQNESVPPVESNSEPSAVPTVSELFSSPGEQSNVVVTTEPTGAAAADSAASESTTIEKPIVVYDEGLNPNWAVHKTSGLEFGLISTDAAHSGDFSFRFTPQNIEETLLFYVKDTSQERYERGEVLGLTFWLNSGNFILNNDALTVTIIGSNDYPYWVEDDNSVVNFYSPVFSETRLYYLGVEEDIPPNTWVQVELWLNERIYDPDYLYVTGFYIKNDESALRDIYLDDIHLITMETLEGAQATPFISEAGVAKIETTVTPTPNTIDLTPTTELLTPALTSEAQQTK